MIFIKNKRFLRSKVLVYKSFNTFMKAMKFQSDFIKDLKHSQSDVI